ncbi:MAG: BON domain-containing protein [Rhizobium sp.]|nr:BON domain-containing protein [Rhizobium sp.]
MTLPSNMITAWTMVIADPDRVTPAWDDHSKRAASTVISVNFAIAVMATSCRTVGVIKDMTTRPSIFFRHDRGFGDRANDEVASWFGDEVAARRREMDGHRGKGPRGYRRSDARILEDVNDRLADDPAIDASDIEVTVEDAEVTLGGHVTDRWEKRRAEDCVDRVSGVTHVQNNLRIRISGEGTVMTQA